MRSSQPVGVAPQYRSWEPIADQKIGMKGLGLLEVRWAATALPEFWATFYKEVVSKCAMAGPKGNERPCAVHENDRHTQCSIRIGLPLPPGPWYG